MTDPAPMPAHDDTSLWLEQLYGHAEGGWLTLFSLDRATGERATDWAPVADLGALAAAAARREPTCCVWFGVATRLERLSGGRRGGEKECDAIPGLWLDIDIEGPGHAGDRLAKDRDHALALLRTFPLRPTVVIDSGGGLQAHWLFGEMLRLADAGDLLASWGATWARLGESCGIAVDNVFDAARIMRLPGTTNRKEGLARPVAILEADWNRRYGTDDIDQHLDAAPTPPTHATKATVPYIGPERPGDAYNARHTGGDVLSAHGFTLARRAHNGEEHWVRPGKDARDGTSATVYPDDGHTTIWSDTCASLFPGVEVRRPYDPFGLHAALAHRGDHSAATSELRAKGYGGPPSSVLDLVGDGVRTTAAQGPKVADRVSEWPSVTPLPERPEPPAIPVDAFPAWMTDHASSVAEQIQVPIDMPMLIALGALSAVMNGYVEVEATDGWVDGVNLWVAVLGRAGVGKSPTAGHMLRPARQFEKDQRRMAADAIRTHELEARMLAKQLKDAEEIASKTDNPEDLRKAGELSMRVDALERPRAGEMFAGDATPEALVELLVNNGEVGCIADTEGTMLSIVAGRYSNKANTEFVLKCWSGDEHNVRRKGSGGTVHRLEAPRLAVVLTIQPKRWAKVLDNPDLTDVGFPDRFMVAHPPNRRPNPDLRRQSLNKEAARIYGENLIAIAERVSRWSNPARLQLDDDAIDTYDAMRDELVARGWDDGDLSTLGEFVAKLEASVLRTAAVLHFAHGGQPGDRIDGVTMDRAVSVGRYWLSHRMAMGIDTQAVEDAREVLRWVRENKAERFTLRELERGVYRFSRSSSDGGSGGSRAVAALELLADLAQVRSGDDWPIGERRPGVKRWIEVNPAVIHRSTLTATGRDTPRQLATEGNGDPSDDHGGREAVAGVAGVASKGKQTPFLTAETPPTEKADNHRDTRDRSDPVDNSLRDLEAMYPGGVAAILLGDDA